LSAPDRSGWPQDFVSLAEWPREALEAILARARELKALRRARRPVRTLEGRSVVLYFEKPSLRTWVTFDIGVVELGGHSLYLPPEQVRIGRREPVEDVGRNLSRWCHAIVARTFSHQLVCDLAHHATVPVVNALTDDEHPCQAMADALTLVEHGDPARERLAFVGDGNNVAHALIHLAGRLGWKLTVCTPPAYAPRPDIVRAGLEQARRSGGDLRLETDPQAAVKDAAFVYTDVWASMGQEEEAEERARQFTPYQVNAELLRHAPTGVRILHDQPAHRGEEITADVFDGPGSLVFEQAENRLHAQKAILEAVIRD
jgi:ornithine carbamoyltransferase